MLGFHVIKSINIIPKIFNVNPKPYLLLVGLEMLGFHVGENVDMRQTTLTSVKKVLNINLEIMHWRKTYIKKFQFSNTTLCVTMYY